MPRRCGVNLGTAESGWAYRSDLETVSVAAKSRASAGFRPSISAICASPCRLWARRRQNDWRFSGSGADRASALVPRALSWQWCALYSDKGRGRDAGNSCSQHGSLARPPARFGRNDFLPPADRRGVVLSLVSELSGDTPTPLSVEKPQYATCAFWALSLLLLRSKTIPKASFLHCLASVVSALLYIFAIAEFVEVTEMWGTLSQSLY